MPLFDAVSEHIHIWVQNCLQSMHIIKRRGWGGLKDGWYIKSFYEEYWSFKMIAAYIASLHQKHLFRWVNGGQGSADQKVNNVVWTVPKEFSTTAKCVFIQGVKEVMQQRILLTLRPELLKVSHAKSIAAKVIPTKNHGMAYERFL